MQYEMRIPTTQAEAIEIIEGALRVIYQQVEFDRGERQKAWNGDFVTHLRKEGQNAIDWLRAAQS